MGDFNIDLLKVNIHAKTNEFVNDVISHGFLPKITRPTRITPHSATLIDHIYSGACGVVCIQWCGVYTQVYVMRLVLRRGG